jgi:hypothetical protein
VLHQPPDWAPPSTDARREARYTIPNSNRTGNIDVSGCHV